MNIVDIASSQPSRRPGRRALDTDLLRSKRVDIDLNEDELRLLRERAEAAALPLRAWARGVLLGHRIDAAHPFELRKIWSESSTLQSNTNQLVARLDELRVAGELSAEAAGPALAELLKIAPALHAFVCQMRVELASKRRAP